MSLGLILTACGGGGGGGGGSTGGSVPTDFVVGACTGTFDRFLDELDSPSGLITIPNRSSGCDYLVDSNVLITRDVKVDAGVTFVMAPGSRMEFRGTNTSVNGTDASPVRFVAESDTTPWEYVYFPRDNTIVTNALFSGGGASSGPYNYAAAMVYSNGEYSKLTNNSFIKSVSVGLSLIDASAQLESIEFSNNLFSGNAESGLAVHSNYLSSLDAESDYDGMSQANGVDGIRIAQSLVARQYIKNINTIYRFEPDFEGDIRFSWALVEPGVTFVIPDDIDVALSAVTINGTASDPVRFIAKPDSISGWGTLITSRNNALRNVILEDGGSQASANGASFSIDATDQDVFENIEIKNARSWGLICRSRSSSPTDQTITIAGLRIENSTFGDINPNCTISELPPIVDGERRDPSNCNARLTSIADLSTTISVLSNSSADCDYYVYGSVAIGGAAGSVTITEGTRILFARNASLSINGSLIAQGTAQNPVVFQGEFPTDGYWQGVQISGSASALNHVNIEDGGSADGEALGINFPRSTVLSANIAASLSNVMVSGSLSDGMVVKNRVSIGEFSNNTMIGNQGFGLRVPIESIDALDQQSIYDSALAPNGRPGIRLVEPFDGGLLLRDGSYTFNNLGAPWSFPSIGLSDSSTGGAQFLINAGTTILFDENAGFSIGRSTNLFTDSANWPSLTITGTLNQPVKISGPAENPTAWGGIIVGGARLDASNVELTGGGDVPNNQTDPVSTGGALVLYPGADIALGDVSIKDSRAWGVSCVRTGPASYQPINVTYMNNALGDVNPDCSF